MAESKIKKPFEVLYEDVTIGTIAASSAGHKEHVFADTRAKSAIWAIEYSTSNRVGTIYMINTNATDDTQVSLWYYNCRTQSADNCKARVFYTLK